MLTMDLFSKLDRGEKWSYLSKILYPIVKDEEGRDETLETFLLGASDEDFVEFYEILLNPEKIDSYINKKWEEIRKWNLEIKNLSNRLNRAKIEMMESINQEDSDEVLRQI